ncbi:MAG TPA: slipin family protein, partial [Mycobacterium sp.]|nr:slipin family protein [Mycobacterium sp.]
ADGELQASEKLSQAAQVMAEEPAALQLRLLQTVVEVAAEKNSTLILPFPVELLRFLERSTPEHGKEPGAAANGETPELAAPKVPDDARGIALDGPLTDRRSGHNA